MLNPAFRLLSLLCLLAVAVSGAPIADDPFWQDTAVRIRHAPGLSNVVFKKVRVDRDNVVYVLTDRGMARVFDDTLVPDRSYRPLAALVPLDIEVSSEGDLYYLYDDRILSNGRNGSFTKPLPKGEFTRIEPSPDGAVVAAKGERPSIPAPDHPVPVSEITCKEYVAGGVWYGTARGAFFDNTGGSSPYATPSAPGIEATHVRYYANKRWLRDDHVIDLAVDRDGYVWILTETGLNKIEFNRLTMAEKAAKVHRKLRSRNMRYGMTGERRMTIPGDLLSSELIDTDNDGGWTSYYIGALAAEYAVTHDAETRRRAWESFAALERMQSIHTNYGFPARTFERRGFKFSDTDRWRDAPDAGWEWKGHTSSDEMQSQCFAHAAMWELVATNDTERARIATNWIPVVEHILNHNLYLVDVDGEPTLWGRWNPEYVNWFPPSIVDRRLNSAEFTGALQLAWRMTGNEKYRAKAFELFEKHGYLTNILSSMKLVAPTTGYVFRDNDMGNEWNHSDDELAFFTYWVLVRFAFNDELRAKYLAAVADHWDFEKVERYPIWNFIYAACGAKDFDPAGAVWTLRGTPLDTIAWRMNNSHRKDITKIEPGFMGRESKELLPPGERLVARINTQPFILDHGDDVTDFPGDEYLLGYWLGRYVGAIAPPSGTTPP